MPGSWRELGRILRGSVGRRRGRPTGKEAAAPCRGCGGLTFSGAETVAQSICTYFSGAESASAGLKVNVFNEAKTANGAFHIREHMIKSCRAVGVNGSLA
jgi:hypothetical protein